MNVDKSCHSPLYVFIFFGHVMFISGTVVLRYSLTIRMGFKLKKG